MLSKPELCIVPNDSAPPVSSIAEVGEVGEAVDGQERHFLVTGDEPAEFVPVDVLLSGDSPRLSGESSAHVDLLREHLTNAPPIIVNRRTMQVIDGMHRLRAARLQGEEKIAVVFVEVTDRDAFLLAVKANVAHGLPLSLSDREAAAERILAWYPLWSDRAIAAAVGLAPKTVAGIRTRSSGQIPQLNARMGLDGRIRPISTTDARRRAWEILTERPETSLREVAKESGISLGTAHDVRERMRQGQDPVPPGRVAGDKCPNRRRGRRSRGPTVWPAVRPHLVKDPTIRYAASGKAFIRWFDTRSISCGEWRELVDTIPVHWVDALAAVAASCADEWNEFARELERRREEMA